MFFCKQVHYFYHQKKSQNIFSRHSNFSKDYFLKMKTGDPADCKSSNRQRKRNLFWCSPIKRIVCICTVQKLPMCYHLYCTNAFVEAHSNISMKWKGLLLFRRFFSLYKLTLRDLFSLIVTVLDFKCYLSYWIYTA